MNCILNTIYSIYLFIYLSIYLYVYIYRERERENSYIHIQRRHIIWPPIPILVVQDAVSPGVQGSEELRNRTKNKLSSRRSAKSTTASTSTKPLPTRRIGWLWGGRGWDLGFRPVYWVRLRAFYRDSLYRIHSCRVCCVNKEYATSSFNGPATV